MADDQRDWIPVTERLPEKDVPVLTFGRHGIVIGAYGREYAGVAGWDAADADEGGNPWLRESGTPTHWMPLPAPPAP